ncbi:MAG: peptidylprolyl isomerase [Gordonia sp. (in: high G+C Gram-positive bacteria)]|uniref:peptidylprolyl isomerase n=1 Tax=Gordonia sp. (in: high G+C Gram-positive bacteria) TaxID=84139 RepID=UPI0039E329E0
MTTNEERREAAKRKLEQRLEAERRLARRRRLMIASAAGVAVLAVVAVGAFFGWRAWDDSRRVQCTYDEAQDPFKQLPAKLPDTVPADQRAQAQALLDYYKSVEKKQRSAPKPDDHPLKEGTVGLTFDTSVGAIPVTLNRADGACNVNGVLSLAQSGYYDDVLCHAIAIGKNGGLTLCGDPTGTAGLPLVEGGNPGWNLPDETPTNLKKYGQPNPLNPADQPVMYPRGTVAVFNANTDGNPMLGQEGTSNTAGGALYFFLKDTAMSPKYAVIGKVDETGLKTLEKIEKGGIVPGPGNPETKPGEEVQSGKPKTDVEFTSVSVKE